MHATLERILLALGGLAILCAAVLRSAALPVRSSKTDAEALRGLAARSQEAYLAGRWNEALEPTLALHEAYPENHVYLGRLAQIYQEIGRPEDEARTWEEYLVVAPIPSEACPQLGRAYWKQGATGKAIDAFERCLRLDPEDPDAIFFMAWGYEHVGDVARAFALYEKGHAQSPGYDDMTLGLARIHLRQGKVSLAHAAASKILARAPENVDALLVLGLSLVREGRPEKARALFEKGASLSDAYADFHLALGRMAESEGKLDEARRRYAHVLDLDPGNAEAREGEARLTRRAG